MYLIKVLLVFALVLMFKFEVRADTTDNYQIYLKNKIVLRESDYNNPLSSTIKFLRLNKSFHDDTIKINYNHCTSGAFNREIIIRDKANNIVFHKYFPDSNKEKLMKIPVKDILDDELIKLSSGLTMYYADSQLRSNVIIALFGIDDK